MPTTISPCRRRRSTHALPNPTQQASRAEHGQSGQRAVWLASNTVCNRAQAVRPSGFCSLGPAAPPTKTRLPFVLCNDDVPSMVDSDRHDRPHPLGFVRRSFPSSRRVSSRGTRWRPGVPSPACLASVLRASTACVVRDAPPRPDSATRRDVIGWVPKEGEPNTDGSDPHRSARPSAPGTRRRLRDRGTARSPAHGQFAGSRCGRDGRSSTCSDH